MSKWPEENKISVKPSKYDLTRYESPSISAVRASNRYTEGLEFDFRWDSDFFLCPTLVSALLNVAVCRMHVALDKVNKT